MIFWLTQGMSGLPVGSQPVSERKFRLFGCACCRKVWHSLTDPRSQRAVEIAEKFADGDASEQQLFLSLNDAYLAWRDSSILPGCYLPWVVCAPAIVDEFGHFFFDALDANKIARKNLAVILRDIVGTPHRQVASVRKAFVAGVSSLTEWEDLSRLFPGGLMQPRWLTKTVRSIALSIYNQGDFAAMPILGDALEDAGCDNQIILDHCRRQVDCARCGLDVTHLINNKRYGGCWCGSFETQIAVHVRGCWVVDLVLGRE